MSGAYYDWDSESRVAGSPKSVLNVASARDRNQTETTALVYYFSGLWSRVEVHPLASPFGHLRDGEFGFTALFTPHIFYSTALHLWNEAWSSRLTGVVVNLQHVKNVRKVSRQG